MRLGRNLKWERVRCTFEGGDQKKKCNCKAKERAYLNITIWSRRGVGGAGGGVYGRWKVGGKNHDNFRKIK